MSDSNLYAPGSDTAAPATIDTAIVALRGYFRRHPDMRCLLLVDPQPRELPASGHGGPLLAELPRAALPIAHDAFPKHQRPYLLTLDPSASQFDTWLAESVHVALADRRPDVMARGRGQRIGGWLASSAPAEDVAEHLSAHVLQENDRGATCALRFYDSRAFALLWSVLSLMQRETLLGPVKVWHAFDAVARLKAYAGLYPPMLESLALKPEQWAAIRRHGVINRALALHINDAGRQPDPEDVEVAVAAAVRAEHYGLDERDDRLAFIRHALTWHPYFDLHPRVIQALREVSPDRFYTAAASELTMHEIDEIRRGAWYAAYDNKNGPRT